MWITSSVVALLGCMVYVVFTNAAERGDVRCPKPRVDHGYLFENKTEYDPDDIVKVYCDEAYRIIGKDRLRCNEDRTWSSNPPYCEEITCQRPPHIMNGSIELMEPALIQTVATFNCSQKFVLVGPPSLVCGVNGEWIPDIMPRCEEVECPKLPTMHGLKLNKQPSVGGFVHLECDDGFALIGDAAVLHCARNGSWVPNVVPFCDEITTKESTNVFMILFIVVSLALVIVIAIVIYRKCKKNKRKPDNNDGSPRQISETLNLTDAPMDHSV